MTLTQLRAFVAVAAAGSVRQAAEHLVVTQPAVSAAVAALQKELGVALVERHGRGLELTRAGDVFARYAREILGLVEEASLAAVGEVDAERGRLRLAAVTTAGEHVIPPFLASFRDHYPEAEIVLEIGNRQRVRDLLANREADLAIGGRPPTGSRLATLATRSNELVVVGPVRDWRPRPATVDELAASTWLLREFGSGTRTTVEELFEELGIAPPTLTLGSNGAIIESVRIGLGITLISRDAVGRELAEGTLAEWQGPSLPLRRTWHAVTRQPARLPATARLFLDHLTDPAAPGGLPFQAV